MTKELAQEVFNQNMYFINTLTSKYITYPNYEDIKQEAYIKAYEAILKWDENKGTKITTWIQAYVEPYLKSYTIKAYIGNDNCGGNSLNYKISCIVMKNKDKSEKEVWDIVRDMGYKVDGETWSYIYNNVMKTNECIDDNWEDGEGKEKKQYEDKYDFVSDFESNDKVKNIWKAVDKIRMSDRSREIFKDWLKNKENGSGMTLEDLGNKYGITRSRAHQIVETGRSRLVVAMKDKNMFC